MVRFSALLFCAAALSAAPGAWVGSQTCAKCHADTYRKYSTTPMALTSGLANSQLLTGNTSFSGNGGYRYSMAGAGAKLILNFQKPDVTTVESRELKYFVGSGTAARSFLLDVGGFLYEAPVTYYSRTQAWDLSPGYGRYGYPFLTRAIPPGCLQCHATGVRPLPATQNGFQSPPFREAGIGCELCHGPGAAHVASGKPANIVNPASLRPEQRESVCAQCHLSGEIRVDRAGTSMSDFTPGDKLSDYATAFVRASSSLNMRVTSHVENLTQSACSRNSGERLWCGTCHDPHFVPSAAEKAGWFRAKCQTCHTSTECRHGDNCIACHMPTAPVSDADHVVYTDHSIPRLPRQKNQKAPANAPLVPFRKVAATTRDQGLAYAIVALREQNTVYANRAFDLLRSSERNNPDDPQTLSYLADLYKTRKDDRTAALLYNRLHTIDPTQSSAPTNLGAYAMEQGRYEEAIGLFNQALRISPALVLVRLNLALALIHVGRKEEARPVLEKALELNPAFTAARNLLGQVY